MSPKRNTDIRRLKKKRLKTVFFGPKNDVSFSVSYTLLGEKKKYVP